jgi:hypothetical protein
VTIGSSLFDVSRGGSLLLGVSRASRTTWPNVVAARRDLSEALGLVKIPMPKNNPAADPHCSWPPRRFQWANWLSCPFSAYVVSKTSKSRCTSGLGSPCGSQLNTYRFCPANSASLGSLPMCVSKSSVALAPRRRMLSSRRFCWLARANSADVACFWNRALVSRSTSSNFLCWFSSSSWCVSKVPSLSARSPMFPAKLVASTARCSVASSCSSAILWSRPALYAIREDAAYSPTTPATTINANANSRNTKKGIRPAAGVRVGDSPGIGQLSASIKGTDIKGTLTVPIPTTPLNLGVSAANFHSISSVSLGRRIGPYANFQVNADLGKLGDPRCQ